MNHFDTLPASSVELNLDKDSMYENLADEGEDMLFCVDIDKHLHCDKYKPDQIQSLARSSNFSILNLNIRSLNQNFDNLKKLLNTLGCCFEIIGCTETHLRNSSYLDLYHLEGYNFYNRNRDRTDKPKGGGVCLFVSSAINVTVRNDLVLDDNYSVQ